MNRINAIMVYAVIIIWTGIVLLYGVTGAGRNNISINEKISRQAPVSKKSICIPTYDPRLVSGISLYY